MHLLQLNSSIFKKFITQFCLLTLAIVWRSIESGLAPIFLQCWKKWRKISKIRVKSKKTLYYVISRKFFFVKKSGKNYSGSSKCTTRARNRESSDWFFPPLYSYIFNYRLFGRGHPILTFLQLRSLSTLTVDSVVYFCKKSF